jgi:phospholipid/cholesterol/gamma-HCH transport system permease protein
MNVFDSVGRGTLAFLEYAGGIADLWSQSVRVIASLRVRISETITHAYLLGYQSSMIVLLTSMFTGMVISLESAEQAVQYGFGTVVGGAVGFTVVRELGPMLTAVVVAGRVGAAIAAELGSMAVTEQIEALLALGLSPVRMLVVPRLLALCITLPLLTVFADIVAIVGGMYVANTSAHIAYDSFIVSLKQQVTGLDVILGLVKGIVFAAIIVLVGSYQGINTRGGAAGVGKSTTGAVVNAIILIFIANFVMSVIMFGARN